MGWRDRLERRLEGWVRRMAKRVCAQRFHDYGVRWERFPWEGWIGHLVLYCRRCGEHFGTADQNGTSPAPPASS